MKRLFLQFYLSVLVILICTGAIYFVISSQRYSYANWQKIEQAMSGGVRMAATQLRECEESQRDELLHSIQMQVDYPVSRTSASAVPGFVQWQLRHGRASAMYILEDRLYLSSEFDRDDENGMLVFGPMPKVGGASQADIAIGLILVLSLMAVAIYLALRPIARQLRQMESTIMTFAGGKLDTRAMAEPSGPMFELAQTFNLMAARTENLVRTQRELLQAVSHELRTPLSRVHFGLDLARDAVTAEEREERLLAIENAAGELDGLVGELLRYVRMESDEIELEIEDTPLRSTISELIEGQQILHPDISFQLIPDQAPEVYVLADRKNYRRAMSNLISNAGKYANSRVLITMSEANDYVKIVIEDDGPGIEAQDCQRIFEPFVRLEESKKGVGLGLALVRRIAQRHQAAIEASRGAMGGLKMTLQWPKHPPGIIAAADQM